MYVSRRTFRAPHPASQLRPLHLEVRHHSGGVVLEDVAVVHPHAGPVVGTRLRAKASDVTTLREMTQSKLHLDTTENWFSSRLQRHAPA